MPDWSLKKFRSYKQVSVALLYEQLMTYHSLHKANKSPKGDGIVLHNSVDGCKKVAHTLYVAEVLVVFVVGQEHILHLLQVDISACIGEWRIWIRMWNVFACEDWDVAICSMYIFFYMADPIEWGKVSPRFS
jgi:hypothetical protein